MNSRGQQPDRSLIERVVANAFGALQGDFVVVGQAHIRTWQLTLLLGIAAGAVAGILFVANRSGQVAPSGAAGLPGSQSIARRGESLSPSYVPGQIIIKLKESAVSSQAKANTTDASLKQAHNLTALERILARHRFKGPSALGIKARGVDRIYLAKLPPGTDEATVVTALKQNPAVEYAERNGIVKTFQVFPNDPEFPKLWGLHNTGQTGGVADADVDAPEAWATAKSSNVIVGVIDTGVDYTHEDLAANMWQNPGEVPGDGIDNDQNGFVDDVYGWDFANSDSDPMDDHGHGTHVSGTIGAVGNNGIGVAGVNWTATIAAIKFLTAGGYGTWADAVSAVSYANLMGFKITSNSWGGGGFSQALYDAIAAGNSLGYLFVAAAGNSATDADVFPMYPAAYNLSNIISVAATDHNDALAYFSNYGLNSVDLGAPGVDTFSSVPKSGCALCDPSGYRYLSGTSMATPHVSGAAALIWAWNPAFNDSAVVKGSLLSMVDPLPALQGRTVSGGRLNLNNPFEVDTTPPAGVSTLLAANTAKNPLSAVTLEWQAVGDDGFTGTASRYDIRYSTSPITASNFGAATPAPNAPKPAPAGFTEIFTVHNLNHDTGYNFALKVYDNLGNSSPISNIATAKTLPAAILYQDSMENGLNGWTVSGTAGPAGGAPLWHQSQRRSASPTTSWYYGQEATGNYDTGPSSTNSGSITSPEIDIANVPGVELSFQHYLETEDFPPFDTASVEVSTDGGNTWTTLLKRTSTGKKWSKENLPLVAPALPAPSVKVKIRFSFDTLDPLFNNFEGWYVDDVVILAPKPLAPVADIKADGSDGPITIPYLGSVSLTWCGASATPCAYASSCTVTAGPGNAPPTWSGTAGSYQTGNLASSVAYTLECQGVGGSAKDSVQVNVGPNLPDLTFTSGSFAKASSGYSYSVVVSNIGSKDSGPWEFRLKSGSRPPRNKIYPSIAAGQAVIIQGVFPVLPVTFTVDPRNLITELDETNNSLVFTTPIPPGPPPPIPSPPPAPLLQLEGP